MPERGGMTQAWNGVQAALPVGWRLVTLAEGPRVADPEIRSEEWVAVARGPNPEQPGQPAPREYGHGANAIQALDDLANRLRRLREE